MAITLKCPDCGHTQPSDDGEPETCPECEGTMAPPPKKKYQAKSTTLEEEAKGKKKSKLRDDDERPKTKTKPKPRDEDDEDERPKAKKRTARDDDQEDAGEVACDGKAAEALDLDPGFKDRALMKQVRDELSRGEVLHFVCRPCLKIAQMQGLMGSAFGGLFAVIGVIALIVFLAGMKVPVFAYLIPVLFMVIGMGIAVVAPIAKIGQAKKGWYAITDRRAIVFTPSLWGSSGQAETYEPYQVRKMWVKKSFWVKGAGDIVFKSITTHTTRTQYDSRGRARTSTSSSTQYFGFLGIEDVKDVQTLLHEVLLARRDDDDEDEDE